MIKKILLIVLLCLAGTSFAFAETAPLCNKGVCTYQPLEPLPGVATDAQSGKNFPALVAGIFKVLLTFGGLFAVVMLTVAGIGYMISESAIDIDKAKKRAQAALWGILLLAGCWLILYTINPDILRFDLFTSALNKLSPNASGPALGTPPAAGVPPTPAQERACQVGPDGRPTGKTVQFFPDGGWACV